MCSTFITSRTVARLPTKEKKRTTKNAHNLTAVQCFQNYRNAEHIMCRL